MAEAFLLVVPPGWTQISDATARIANWGEDGLTRAIAEHDWGTIEGLLDNDGLVPPGKIVAEARLIDNGGEGADRLHFWVRFVDIS